MPDIQTPLHIFLDPRCREHCSTIAEAKKPAEPEVEWFWKELIRVGDFEHPATGTPIPVSMSRLEHWRDCGNEMNTLGVRIPVNREHGLMADSSLGTVEGFKIEGDGLYGKLRLIGADAGLLLARNDVSVGIMPGDYKDSTGKVWHDVLYHVAVTQFPVITDLSSAQAIAASQLPAMGAMSLYTFAGNLGDKKMSMIPCSAECLAALRQQQHLGLEGCPDGELMSKVLAYHAKHAQTLSTIKRDVPGMNDCPAGDEMSRLAQHLSTMKAVREKLYGANSAAHLSVQQQDTILMSRVEELSTAGKALTEKDATITALRTENQHLSTKVVKDVDPQSAVFLSELVKTRLGGLVTKGQLSAAASTMLFDQFCMSDNKVNTLMCSALANPFGTKPAILALLDILEANTASPATGTATGGQHLSRIAPGSDLDDNDATKQMQLRMQKNAEATRPAVTTPGK